jgi:hypothetical protein
VIVGPVGAGGRTWCRWAARDGRKVVVADGHLFPTAEWLRAVAEQVDLPGAAIRCLAQRAGRRPDEFLAAWRVKTRADRDRFWSTLAPQPNDDLLDALAELAVSQHSPTSVAAALSDLGDRIILLLLHLQPPTRWPALLFLAGSIADFSAVGAAAVQSAMSATAVPIAVAVSGDVWHEFLRVAPESRVKALLREGELTVAAVDPATIERVLEEAGGDRRAATTLAAMGADLPLIESAAEVLRATASPPTTKADDDRARSAAERFLFAFLEALPETAGRFELNAPLDFRFGTRPAEVDLLCRSPRIAIELDGYFHFLVADGYRRDRTKDWELQRRGYLVLRFLAEDVIRHLEIIRDRILAALTIGGHP